MSTVWGPYQEFYDPTHHTYALFKAPNPSPIKMGPTPILKDSVSMLLNEILKPARVFGAQILDGAEVSPDKPDESRLRAAIALMDQSVVKAVQSARDLREAIAILSSYDPRFEDVATNQACIDKVLNCFHRSDVQTKKFPGPHSDHMDLVRKYFEKHSQSILRALAQDHSLQARRVLALEITIRVLESDAQKPADRVMRFLRMIVQTRMPKRKSRATR